MKIYFLVPEPKNLPGLRKIVAFHENNIFLFMEPHFFTYRSSGSVKQKIYFHENRFFGAGTKESARVNKKKSLFS